VKRFFAELLGQVAGQAVLRVALFYKTQNGASVGDLYMSLFHTCELNDANPFEFLTALQAGE